MPAVIEVELATVLQSSSVSLCARAIAHHMTSPQTKTDVNSLLYKWLRQGYVAKTSVDASKAPQWQLTDKGHEIANRLVLNHHIFKIVQESSDEDRESMTGKILRKKLKQHFPSKYIHAQKDLIKTIGQEKLASLTSATHFA